MTEEVIIIEKVDEKSRRPFCACLEEWSDEIREAGDLKADWYEEMNEKGLGALIARNSRNEYLGMIQYIPAEYAQIEAEGFYHIYCTWVHSHKGKGVGDQRKKGIGKALLKAAEEEIRNSGAEGITAWGLILPFWMKASWYRIQGFRSADRAGIARLMWKPLKDGVSPPRWMAPSPLLKEKGEGDRVRVLSVVNGICPAMNITHERIRRLMEEFPDRVDYKVERTDSPEKIRQWGVADSLYINGRSFPLGPPPSMEKLRKKIKKEIKKSKKGFS